jgi:hypothetical protein
MDMRLFVFVPFPSLEVSSPEQPRGRPEQPVLAPVLAPWALL